MRSAAKPRHGIVYKLAVSVLFCLLLAPSCILLFACGRKGEPTLKSYEKPPSPSELRGLHRESDITLFWDFPKSKEQSLKGFFLSKSTGGEFGKIAFIENDKRSSTDKDFQTGHTYKYKIASESLKGVVGNDSNVFEIKPLNAPSPPKNISFSIGQDSVILKWDSAGEGIFYDVYKSDVQGAYSLDPLNKEPLRDTSFKDTFSAKKPVLYTLRSLLGGGARDEGPASEEVKIDPAELVPSAPERLQAVATEGSVYLSWKEPRETWVTGYRIYRETKKEEGYILIGDSQTPSFIDKDPPLRKRNYEVTALGPSKEGPPTDIRDVIYEKPR